jgi:hypothetical protein
MKEATGVALINENNGDNKSNKNGKISESKLKIQEARSAQRKPRQICCNEL